MVWGALPVVQTVRKVFQTANTHKHQMVNSALRYRSHPPLVDGLLKELGLNGGAINGLTQGLDKTIDQS